MADPAPTKERERLADAAHALDVALNDHQQTQLVDFIDLLDRWNRTYNLTSVRQRGDMLVQHVFDCLAIIEPMRRAGRADAGMRILDVGSGGGLPGVVLAIALPAIHVVCVDAVGKKAAFVRQVALELGLSNLSACHARVERLSAAPFDLITSRAFASLSDFTALTKSHLATAGCWLAMKGASPDAEISALPSTVDVFHVEHITVPDLDAARCLVWMRPSSV